MQPAQETLKKSKKPSGNNFLFYKQLLFIYLFIFNS